MDGADEFLTAMTFDGHTVIRQFTGTDESVSVVPPEARALLARHDNHSRHYELLRRDQ